MFGIRSIDWPPPLQVTSDSLAETVSVLGWAKSRAEMEARVKQQEEKIKALQAQLADLQGSTHQGSTHLHAVCGTESDDDKPLAAFMAKRGRDSTGGPSAAPPTKRQRRE